MNIIFLFKKFKKRFLHIYIYIYIYNSKKVVLIYTGCIKKNCTNLNLGTYNVEKWKKFLELKFCEPGVCVFSNKLKMACARNLKALIIF